MMHLACCCLLLAAVHCCHSANILAVFPALSRSHVISFSSLTKELASRGHHVVVISSYPQERPLENYTDITVPLDKFGIDTRMDMKEMKQMSIFDNLKIVWEIGVKTCDSYLSHPSVQPLVEGRDHQFDLLIVEVFLNECFLGFSHVYDVPVVGVSSFDAQHWSLAVVGNPSPYAHTPNIFLGYGDHMSFTERLVNTIGTTIIQVFKAAVNLPAQDRVMRKYFNDSSLPHVTELERRTSLLLINSHVSIGYPRPFLPNVVEVGGMHIRPTPPLPKDLQRFMDEAEHGVVVFSMGTNLMSFHMPAEKLRAFVDAFSRLKQRVVWRWDSEVVPGLTSNVRVQKWLPQASVLAHPNTRLLLTHGGMLSLQEAVHHSVPLVGIPIFADQHQNIHRVQLLGLGVRLDLEGVTSDSVYNALHTVLNNDSYYLNAKKISARFHDQIATPIEKAVYWTEYVIRHHGAPHLRTAALDLAWYEYFLLDVLAALATIGILIAVVIYFMTRLIVTAAYETVKEIARTIVMVTWNVHKKKIQ